MKLHEDCDYVMEKFLELDKNEMLPLWMTKHLLMCDKCRANVRRFSHAEKILSKSGKIDNPFSFATISDIKEQLYPGSTKAKKVPILYWLIIGIILLVCLTFLTIYLSKFLPQMQTYISFFMAGIIITYCMLFIGLNLDFFVKK